MPTQSSQKTAQTHSTPDKGSNTALKIIGIVALGIVGLLIVAIVLIGIVGSLISSSLTEAPTDSGTGNVALVPIKGTILTESSSDIWGAPQGTSAAYISDKLRELDQDRSIDAVILHINSPGGSGVASDQISKTVKSMDKPVVAYVDEVGASGAYWVASATDHILVNRLSLVGSIGVVGSYLDFSGLLDDFNVTYQRFVAGENKDFGSPFREPTQGERVRYQQLLDEMHTVFIHDVAEGRNMSSQDIRELADGFVYSGQQALDNGLADALGGRQEAIDYLEETLGNEVNVREIKERRGFWDILASATSPQREPEMTSREDLALHLAQMQDESIRPIQT